MILIGSPTNQGGEKIEVVEMLEEVDDGKTGDADEKENYPFGG